MDGLECYGVFPEENVIQVSEGSEGEEMDIPLRRSSKAVSLAAGLNRLQVEEDEPDGEGSSAGQSSFLHSKYLAHSTYNLSDVGSSETEEKKKTQHKKKSNRISRVIEEFISMGDAISYADKRLSKSFASLQQPEEYNKEEESRPMMADEKDNIIVVDHEESPERKKMTSPNYSSDIEVQLRQRKTGSSPRSSGSSSRDQLQRRNPSKERERRRTYMEKRGESSKRVSQVVHPFQLSVTAPSPSPTSPEEVPPLPQGKTIFDVRLNFSVDKVFELCYTDSQFYRSWMFDPKRPGEPKQLNVGEWLINAETGLKEREINFELFQDFVITKAVITTNLKQSLTSWSRPGQVYGVEVRVTNKGPPLADSFVLTEHHRLTSTGETGCHYVKVAKVDFLKYSLLKGKIESETWAGIAKAEEVLEEKFHDIDSSQTNARGKTKKKTEKQKHSTSTTKTSKIPSINFYPENWRWTGQIILAVILAILILVVISLFKMVSTLDNIDSRLHNMEKLFNLS